MLDKIAMPDRIIGILGGMGPEATGDLFQEIVRLTPASRDQDHLPVLVFSNPKVPERTPAILGSGEDPVPYLVGGSLLLQKAGAGIISIPCNTAHFFLAAVQKEINIPILNMISESADHMRRQWPSARCAGLLASLGTVKSRIYESTFDTRGIRVLAPDLSEQELVSEGIKTVKAGRHDSVTRKMFQSIGQQLVKRGAEVIILGCTEIPLAFEEKSVCYSTLNPTRILAQACVDWALGKRR